MSKVLVLYYSAYGHIEAMANAVAEGARQAGAHVDIKRVPELVPEDIARKSHYKFDQVTPIAKVDDLTAYDAIIIGAGTRFGRMPSQMGNFLDRREDFGRAEHCTARSAAHSRRAPRNMAGRRMPRDFAALRSMIVANVAGGMTGVWAKSADSGINRASRHVSR